MYDLSSIHAPLSPLFFAKSPLKSANYMSPAPFLYNLPYIFVFTSFNQNTLEHVKDSKTLY